MAERGNSFARTLAHLEKLKEFTLGRRQRGVRQDLEQISKVIAAVEGDPLHLLRRQTPLVEDCAEDLTSNPSLRCTSIKHKAALC